LVQEDGLGAARFCELHNPTIVVAEDPDADDPDELSVVAGVLAVVLAAVLVLGKLDGWVGSSELLECWKPQAAKTDDAANAARRRTTFFIEGPCTVPDYKTGVPLTNLAGGTDRTSRKFTRNGEA
jgi:hypothetical protein